MTKLPQLSYIPMSEKHSLVSIKLPREADVQIVKVVPRTNHIIAIDCSGSMYSELPKIREQLKNKLPQLVKEGDTVSIIWFSGRGQVGFISKGLEIKTAVGLKNLQDSLDRFLRTVGATGFKDPLLKAGEAVADVTTSTGITTHSLLFLTDGYDNEWSKAELIKAVKPLGPALASATFVEYGYWCNRALLQELAQEVGGRSIFSETFQDYEPNFEQVITNKISGKPKKRIELGGDAKYGIAFSYDAENGVIVYAVEDGAVLVDDEVNQIFYHAGGGLAYQVNKGIYAPLKSAESVASIDKAGFTLSDIYASMLVLSQRVKSQDVYDTLGFLGDVNLIKGFTNAFGKQNLYAFQNNVLETIQGQRKPYLDGIDLDFVPKPDAFCLLNLFELLMQSDQNRFISTDPNFKYNRIGSKKVAAVSKEEARLQDELTEVTKEWMDLSEQVKKDSSKRPLLTEAAKRMSDLTEQIEDESEATNVKFVANPNPNGTPIADLVWNESRPNLSVRVKSYGKVELPESEVSGGLKEVDSFIYRNYTLVKDGIVNVDIFPVRLAEDTFNQILAKAPQLFVWPNAPEGEAGVDYPETEFVYDANDIYYLALKAVPVINRQMVLDVSAIELAKLQYELTKAQFSQAVYNYLQKEHFPRESKGYTELYGLETSEWLKSLGVTDFNGFAPRVTAEKTGESYPSTELNVAIKGLASKPTMSKVWEKFTAGNPKLTEGEQLMKPAYDAYKTFIDSDEYKKSKDQDDLLKAWIEIAQKSTVNQVREYLNQMARVKFAIILGQVWFKEFKDYEDNVLNLTIDNKPLNFTFKLEDKVVEI